MRLGQILVLAHAVAEAHAEDSARADCRERLHHLIAGVARIRPRVEPDLDALHAVRLQRPDRKCEYHRERHDPKPVARLDENGKRHQERHAEHNARRPEVRLLIDEERHHENCPKRNDDQSPVPLYAESLLAEHRRDRERPHQHRHQLRKLRRLKAQRAEREPALRPVDRRPDKEHGNQQKDRDPHAHEHQHAHPLVIHAATEPARNNPDQEPLEMPLQEIIWILEVHRREHIARAEYIDRPRHKQNRHDDDNRLRLTLKERIARTHQPCSTGGRATSRPIFAPRALNLRSYSVMILSASPSAWRSCVTSESCQPCAAIVSSE